MSDDTYRRIMLIVKSAKLKTDCAFIDLETGLNLAKEQMALGMNPPDPFEHIAEVMANVRIELTWMVEKVKTELKFAEETEH